ncbi:MAG TPA: 50S ribosomal protein L24 [Chloroflexia bacterium]|nr:50S ribosomal protein L24 [Chloroflexia bacterium]
MKVHKGDTVVVISGKDKGKRGVVREVHPDNHKVIVEGMNVMRKHTRGQRGARQAGVVEVEAPMHASKVMVYCGECRKPVRVGHTFLADGSKARVCPLNHDLDRYPDPDKRWS